MNEVSITLSEWETCRPDPGTELEGVFLSDDAPVRRVAEELSSSGRLEIVELAKGLLIKAFSYVGSVRLGGLRITIRPKISDAGHRRRRVNASVGMVSALWLVRRRMGLGGAPAIAAIGLGALAVGAVAGAGAYPYYGGCGYYGSCGYAYPAHFCVTRSPVYDDWGNFVGYQRMRVAC